MHHEFLQWADCVEKLDQRLSRADFVEIAENSHPAKSVT